MHAAARGEFLYRVCHGGSAAVWDCLVRWVDGSRYHALVVQPADHPPSLHFLSVHFQDYPQDFRLLP